MSKPVVLAILDGFGISEEERGNAVRLANKPNFKKIGENFLGTTLHASGIEVGVPWGEVGSSEVGHTNIGAGLVIYQNYPRISLAIKDESFFKIPIWDEVIKKPAVHLFGLLTNSGIHAHVDHLIGLLRMLSQKKYKGEVFVHAFTDGEDAPPKSASIFLEMVEKEMKSLRIGKIASITGRYWAMDRNKNLDRTEKTIACMTEGTGVSAESAGEALARAYQNNISDELIEPTVIVGKNGQPVGLLKKSDAAIFFNFRPDRARQITEKMSKIEGLFLVTLTQFEEKLPVKVAFPPQYITHPLARIVSDAGKSQFHIAESEKYAHATYFFNGGVEEPFPGEDRSTIPSPAVSEYDQKPEMSAYQITERILTTLEKQKYDFIVVNFANGDMVGHTGNLKAATKAVEVLDECIGKIASKVLALDGNLIITADHGNCEEMIDLDTGVADTEHSTNPVPLFIIGNLYLAKEKPFHAGEPTGILADVAPTILEIMQIPQPKEMTGRSLLKNIGRLAI
ncbi:MAG: 2,3-bisphosphoglycerate-independent phosphoglycerate mutase [Parcubacteria group bacterium Gr01-1014_19]|nr:MAG: 2,3-bisphosphoglycerate-independent phosphoglycerate mutase [Parcubacteria group bacterium Gr01-1014_19]